MTDNRRHGADLSTAAHVVRAALALAAHYFPRPAPDGRVSVRIQDALFLLSGQMSVWATWAELPLTERTLIARLLRRRPVEIANRTVFLDLLHLLIPHEVPDFRLLDDDVVLAETGRPPLVVADECVHLLWAEEQLRPRRPQPIATDGTFLTLIRARDGVAGISEARYLLDVVAPPPATPHALEASPEAEEVVIPLEELTSIAVRLDEAFGQQHRTASLERLFTHLHARPGHEVDGQWRLRAGPTQLFNAPTGVGKNVLAELVAVWSAHHEMVFTLLVPRNAVVVQSAHAIERALAALDVSAEVVPLMSPRSLQEVAEGIASNTEGDASGLGMWAYQRLSYGCALPSAAQVTDGVDAWQPGQEPCGELRRVRDDDRSGTVRHACPWRPTCGKFRLARQALKACVIVTSHGNFLSGGLQVPVEIDGRIEENPTVEQVLLHRSHVVFVDEVDAFQASMIGSSAKGLTLARRRGERAPLVRLDGELQDALSRMDTRLEGRVRAAVTVSRYLAESYTHHLAAGHFQRTHGNGHPLAGRWVVPRRWDAWLAATLFGLPEETPPTEEHRAALRALFPGEPRPAELPAWLEPVAHCLARVISPDLGDDAFDDVTPALIRALGEHPYGKISLDDAEVKVLVTDRLVRRAYLERLRHQLMTFVYAAPQLGASGVAAAGEVAQALGRYARWSAAPYGPLGRVMFAFTETYDQNRPQDTALSVSAFGGDPHNYVAALGEITALAHTGRRRIVVGLSATAYFPGAPHHHLHVPPTWWVPDDHVGGIVVRAAPVSDEERQFLRVSGRSGKDRSEALINIGRFLWMKRLAPALDRLQADPGTSHRARLLLATTSYQGGQELAEGLNAAGVPAERIVLAVRPPVAQSAVSTSRGRWTVLAADQLERFGRTVGTASGSLLIAPLARAERGLNIVDGAGRSLIGSVWLIVRPVPILDDPTELLAHVNARAYDGVVPTTDPAAVLDLVRTVAGRHYDELFKSLPYFRALPRETQLAIAKETLNGLIQLAGRARRGGDIGEIHLVDHAFHDTDGRSDLPTLIDEMRQDWDRDGHLELMHSLYGRTLGAIFDFADQRKADVP